MRLTAPLVADALRSGIHRVIGEQETLNRINVFPVADGDTGTNLSLSLGAALDVLGAGHQHVGQLLMQTADTLLDSARGNSGAIVAQFFQGMSDATLNAKDLTASAFSAAVSLGNEYAHDALAEPKEGTILSVIAAFADGLRHAADRADSPVITPALLHALAVAQSALATTTEQLEVLKKAGVVDAGAKGFVALVEGVVDVIAHGKETPRPVIADALAQANATLDAVEAVTETADLQFRFCTECIITAVDIDRRKLRERLSAIGNSLVLAGTKRKAKIHIHANDPETVFEVARQFGELGSIKADDMHRQQQSTQERRGRFAVITDSAADIPDEALERFDIHLVPCRVQFGERGYLDKVSISTEEFFRELAENPSHPTTSQPAPGDFRRQFEHLASHFPDVISVNLTDKVSGTYQAALAAAGRVQRDGAVHVVNSLNASVGQGLLAQFAAECAVAGMDVQQTLRELDKLIPATRSYALLQELHYAERGGRLPGWVRLVADLLRVSPILETRGDGSVSVGGILPGRKNRLAKFARYLERRAPNGAIRIAIGHAICDDDAEALRQMLTTAMPAIADCTVTGLGSALGAHGGPGSIVVAMQPLRRATVVS